MIFTSSVRFEEITLALNFPILLRVNIPSESLLQITYLKMSMESHHQKIISIADNKRPQFVSTVEKFQQYEPVAQSPSLLPSPEGRQPSTPEIDLYEDYQPVVLSPLTPLFYQVIVDRPKTTTQKQKVRNPQARRTSLQCRVSLSPSAKMAGCTPPKPLQDRGLVVPSASKVKRCLSEEFVDCNKESVMTF